MNIYNVLDGLTEYEICNANRSASIRLIPELGGIVTSFIADGKEMLYLDRQLLHQQNITAGGIPFLFPVCGGLVQDRYAYKGKEYAIPSHGFARTLPWQVLDNSFQTPGEIKLRLLYSENTLKLYPFKFEVLLHYIVQDNALTINQTYINSSNEAMPFYSGFHPYFAVKDKKKLKFDMNVQSYLDYTTDKVGEYSDRIDFDNAVDFVFPLEQTKPYICRMTDPESRHVIEIQTAGEFTAMVLWTEKDKDFICIEPWMAGPNAMNTGKDLLFIPAGNEIRTWVKFLVHGQ